ncbi:MAG: VTT domain-containing protein [Bacteroidetes bacterium]|nr:VTT domain-containing protein [Bacteroidota bacterium]MBP7399327.1 VTT domain-containing protein [Chitinophagales bacterium]MBK7109545.1 VTT domain-containing protein [Bacteroidota bacterium]MBK8487719.1 VTT domain-containing protein [Bacteroidota bacterium]MBK8682539.1 VTT domain-containing protein [Bacteroidota bacterium]
MDVILEYLQHLLDPDWIMKNGGLYLVLLILFIETGIIIGFFLPGDPLLFISGMIISSANETPYPFANQFLNLLFWMMLFAVSTILGNFFGYWFGYKFKHKVNIKEDTWFLKRKHIQTAHDFYEKRGGFAIAIARFLPIVRTFAPIIAGTVEMNYKKFAFYNIIGAVVWVGSITSLGYVLGDIPWVKSNLEYIIIGLVIIVTSPIIIKLAKKKEKINHT